MAMIKGVMLVCRDYISDESQKDKCDEFVFYSITFSDSVHSYIYLFRLLYTTWIRLSKDLSPHLGACLSAL